MRYFFKSAILFLLYFSTALFCLSIVPIEKYATALWPPTGIALSLLFLWGYRFWPSVFFGAVLVSYYIETPFLVSLGIGAGNAIGAIVGVFLLRKVDFIPSMVRIRDVLSLVIFGAILSTLLSTVLIASTLLLGHVISISSLMNIWGFWWFGDMMGDLIVAPLIFVWMSDRISIKGTRSLMEALLLACIITGISLFVFSQSESALIKFMRPFIVVPFIAWAAIRFEHLGGVTMVGIVSMIAIGCTVLGYGPYGGESPSDKLFLLQSFLGIVSFSVLVLGSMVAEANIAKENLESHVLKRTRELIEAREERDRFFRLSPDFISTSGFDGYLKEINPSFEKNLGYSKQELLENPYMKFIHSGDRKRVELAVESLSKGLDITTFTFRVIRKDGSVRWWLASASPFLEKKYIYSISKDITDQKLAVEGLQRVNEELDQFAYMASHDLQAPLRVVSNFIELLRRRYQGKLDKDADEFITYIVNGVETMKMLINNLLNFSRLGRDVPKVPVDLESVFQEVLSNLKVTIEEKQAKIIHDSLPQVIGNRTQFVQLFQNLIDNALKFQKKGVSPNISVSVEEKEQEYVFAFKDGGIGIESKYFDQIFKLSRRLHTAQEYPGTGIGLAICKKIVINMEGNIWFESTFGEGSTFFFSISKKST